MRCFSCSPLCRLNGVSLVSAGGFSMFFPQFQWSDELPCASSCGTFYYVFQLAQVAWPRIALECFACRRVKSGQVAFQFAVCLVEEEIARAGLSSRRSFRSGMRRVNSLMRWYRSSRKVPLAMPSFRFSVGGTDKAYVHFDFFGRTDAADAPFLQGTQQLYLYFVAQVSYFVQKECASVCFFESTRLVGQCACK